MAKSAEINNLGYLGAKYQLRLVKCFIEDRDFFSRINHIVDQNLFTEEALRRIVGLIKDRYAQVDVVPTYNDIDVLIRSKISSEITVNELLETVEKMKKITIDGIDLIEDEAERFFKQQNLTKALIKANDIIRKGNASDYYAIEDIVRKALEINAKQEMGYCVLDNIESDLREDYRQTIPTGCPELDEALYGGIGRGELGIIIAPLGTGKTSLTTGISAAAATTKTEYNNYQGFKVLHLFFEDEEVNINRKYFGNLLDIDACDLSLPNIKEDAMARLKEDNEKNNMIRSNVRAMRLSSGEVTASQIKGIINKHVAMGFKPDLVIVDYFECLKPERSESLGDNEWTREGVTMRKLESICKETKVAIWVPIQSTKNAIGLEEVTLKDGGGSVKKTQIGHLIITLAQTDEQKAQGRLNVYIKKLRAVKTGRTKFNNVKFNNGTGKFDMDDLEVVDRVIDGNTMSNTSQNVAKNVAKENRNKF